jgi:hypothetical protein
VPERHVQLSTRSGHLDVRSDHRLTAAYCRPHRFSEHIGGAFISKSPCIRVTEVQGSGQSVQSHRSPSVHTKTILGDPRL